MTIAAISIITIAITAVLIFAGYRTHCKHRKHHNVARAKSITIPQQLVDIAETKFNNSSDVTISTPQTALTTLEDTWSVVTVIRDGEHENLYPLETTSLFDDDHISCGSEIISD